MKPDQTHPNPDQQDTLKMDLSPVVRTFFGAPSVEDTQKPAFNPFRPKPNDNPAVDSILNGTTRRLDSFAVPEEPVNPTIVPEVPPSQPRTPEPKDSEELTSGEVTPRRDLLSVFDKEVWGDLSQFRIC